MTASPPPQKILGLFAWLLVCFAAAGIGGVASAQAGPFYQTLFRPAWAPPGWIFGPVWTLLYLCMAFSAWLVWRIQGFRKARIALSLFLVQLALNALWTWLFFAWHLGGLAFAEILVLLASILATIVAFWRIHPRAALLLLPYLA
ncbi:TspO/MBR family protein [Holophaga foetida]|uniref:TspO/MBR family protein n=1 Tax=Holophaga foetida TaxID=35839 RepID=UPI000A03BBD7